MGCADPADGSLAAGRLHLVLRRERQLACDLKAALKGLDVEEGEADRT